MDIDDYKPTPPEPISSYRDGDTWVLVFGRHFRQPPQRVWKALVDKDEIPKWAPYGPDRNLDTTGPAVLTMYEGSEPDTYHIEVQRVIAGRLLEYTWGESVLLWELERAANGTRLTLHHRVPKFDWLGLAAAGWHLCLDVAALLMDGVAIGPIHGEVAMSHGWKQLKAHYDAMLGPGPEESGEDADAAKAGEKDNAGGKDSVG